MKRSLAILAGIVLIIGISLVVYAQSNDQTESEPITLTVSAAASLTSAFEELGPAFEAETGIKVIFNHGSSGQLAEQIRQGAPVDVYAAANVDFVDQLIADGFAIPETKSIYAQGRITLWVRQDSPLQIESLDDLTGPDIERIAIANPDNAPYGVAAVEALQAVGSWDALSSKILLGKNVSQTLSYAQTGEVSVAIIALSLSIPSDGRWVLIPAELHTPLNQALAVLSDTPHPAEAKLFANYVTSTEGRAIMGRYGFLSPDENMTDE